MKSAREIAYLGLTVALLIGGQFALSMVSGVEVVTAIFAVYCFVFGVLRGITVASVFSIARCLVFGFFPQVVILYLIYYNLFAVVIGLVGKTIKNKKDILKIVVITVISCVLTVCFTAIDNLINLVVLNLSPAAFRIYLVQSIPVVIRQIVCVAVTLPLLYYPLYKVFSSAYASVKN